MLFLTLSVEKMGGKVASVHSPLEDSLSLFRSSSTSGSRVIICPYLKPGQRQRVEACLGDAPIPIVSSYWLYACIDHCTCLSLATSDPYDRVLFTPGLRCRNEGENEP